MVSKRKVQGTRGSERSAAQEGVQAQCGLAVCPRTVPERPPLRIHGDPRCSAAGEGDEPCST